MSRALESIGVIARITRVRGARGLVLAEKSGAGWTRRSAGRGRQAFTRVELCACLAAGALLVLLALPALATSQSRGHGAQCLNNLRLMGRAVQMWASDYQGEAPWRTRQQDGGLLPSSGTRPGNAWFDLYVMSNQLVTPRILACPSDQAVVANDFPQYASTGFRNFATSYMLNMDSFAEYPLGFLFGDRNVRLNSSATSCSAGINNTLSFYTGPGSDNGWTNSLHGLNGNIVVFDGSVAQTTTEQLSAAMKKSKDDNAQTVHLLKPR